MNSRKTHHEPDFLPIPDEAVVALREDVFTAQVTGLIDDTPQQESTLTVCKASTITEAVQKLNAIHLAGDWPVREDATDTGQPKRALNFIPQTVMMYDRQGRKVLGGRFDTDIIWAQPVTLASERMSLEKQRQRLCREAVFEHGWENYRAARLLWQKAHLLSLHVVASRYQQCREVNDILLHSASVSA
ncbi:hypothetical protein [Xenorhabdus bovienii]|uniref:hypothetical protein n=1 Tax=Xenorhabdus bovienii TaxID=40576 RepID=UPI0012D2D8B3|nr:hypothetical protein [Xenorhabdus bovienii]